MESTQMKTTSNDEPEWIERVYVNRRRKPCRPFRKIQPDYLVDADGEMFWHDGKMPEDMFMPQMWLFILVSAWCGS